MTKTEMIKTIKDFDLEELAWWSPSELDEMGLRFSTTSKLIDEGWLIYEGGDDVYVGPKTYEARWV